MYKATPGKTWMKFKHSKSRTICVIKGKLKDQRFYIDGAPIPMVSKIPIKSLGQWYNASFKDLEQSKQLKEKP